MEEAEVYPDDYDGIEAGSPGQDYTHLMESFLWGGLLPARDPAARLTPAALQILSGAVLRACGSRAEQADGFLLDPRSCHFELAVLQCHPGRTDCLSAAQVAEANRLYTPITDPLDHHQLYPAFARGSESEWGLIQGVLIPFYAQPLLANAVYADPNWDWRRFDFHVDAKRLDETLSPVINADSPDLDRFAAHGGKLIVTQGWADALNAQTLPVEYQNLVVNRISRAATDRFFRLYLVPGMSHCGHGPGPTTIGGNSQPTVLDPAHDVLAALERWTEEGTPPGWFVSTRYADGDPEKSVAREIRVCPYPTHTRFRGGDPAQASSYDCAETAGQFLSDLSDERSRAVNDRAAKRLQNLPN